MIVDTHLHVVSADLAAHPWVTAEFPAEWLSERPHDVAATAAVLDRAGVHRGLLVQAVGAYGTDCSYLIEAVATAPGRFGGVGVIDPTAADRLDRLEHLVAAGVRGLRLFSIPTPTPSWLDDPDTWPVWEAARDLEVHLSVCCLPAELGALDRVLAAHPHTDVVLDHCGFVEPDHLDLLDPLARHERLVLKITSHVLTHAPNPAALVDALADRVGADRLVWGSDHPQVPLPYPDMVDLAEQALIHRSGAERAAVLGGTALRLWPELRGPSGRRRAL